VSARRGRTPSACVLQRTDPLRVPILAGITRRALTALRDPLPAPSTSTRFPGPCSRRTQMRSASAPRRYARISSRLDLRKLPTAFRPRSPQLWATRTRNRGGNPKQSRAPSNLHLNASASTPQYNRRSAASRFIGVTALRAPSILTARQPQREPPHSAPAGDGIARERAFGVYFVISRANPPCARKILSVRGVPPSPAAADGAAADDTEQSASAATRIEVRERPPDHPSQVCLGDHDGSAQLSWQDDRPGGRSINQIRDFATDPATRHERILRTEPRRPKPGVS
jgi:hypothetical protein